MKFIKAILSFAVFLLCLNLLAQNKVSGKVSDGSESLSFCTVHVLNSTKGVSTDTDGNFELENVFSTDTLVISFIGFITEYIPVGSQTFLEISLTPDIQSLAEVVVVGYGTVRRTDITGSISSLKPKDLANLPVSRTDQALQGRIAGVNIQNNNASPNAETKIRIRGSNSLLGSNDPLIVVDGFQDGSLNLIHPSDIQSIEALKDASALAIYGAKGANGAVLITTKNGSTKKEGIGVNYSNYIAWHQIRNKLNLLNASEYATRQNQDALERGGTIPFTTEQISEFQANGGTDWQDEIYRGALAQNHHLALFGQTKKTNFFVSGDVLDQKGIVLGSEFNRYAFRGNLEVKPVEKVKINVNTFLSRSKDSPITLNSFSGENAGSAINSALIWSPTDPVFSDPSARTYTLPGFDTDVGPVTDYNPVALAAEPIRENIRLNMNFNGSIAYEPLEGLMFQFRGAIRLIDNENNQFINNKPTQIANSESASIYNSKNLFTQTSYLVTYSPEINVSHSLKITGLFEEQFNEFNDNGLGARGFISDVISFNNLGLGQEVFPPASSRSKRSLRSYMGRLNYGFKGKYLLTLTSRWDASSVFGNENKWAFFPSLAVGWNMTDEPFASSITETLSNLKLRASYGYTGSQAIAPGGSIGLIGDNFSYPLNGVSATPGIGISDRAPNPDLKWETTAQFNTGIDAELYSGRINLTIDYYIKKTRDLLFEQPIAESSGYSSQFVNLGELENKGLEIYLEGTPIDKKIRWTTGVTYAKNQNKVLELLDNQNEIPVGSVGFPGFDNFIWLQVGQPIGQFRGVKFDGVWQSNELTTAELYGAIPGSPKAIDQNGDNLINDEDIVILGNSQPDFIYGWNNNFQYKKFQLSIFVQGVVGIDKLNLSKLQLLRGTGADLLNRWTPTKPNTEIPSVAGEAKYSIGNSDRFIEDASYLRIKNISLTYNLSKDLVSKIGLQSASIYISGYNLFTFTSYSGYDPESTRSGRDFTDVNSGIDLASFPEQKIFSTGLNITF